MDETLLKASSSQIEALKTRMQYFHDPTILTASNFKTSIALLHPQTVYLLVPPCLV